MEFMTRSITIEDLNAISFLSKPRISPDAQRVALVATTIDERKHQYRSAIWIAQSDGTYLKRFTSGKAKVNNPVWSPDGRWLAFVSEREGEPVGKNDSEEKKRSKGKPQIWLIPTDGGEARQLTFMPHGAASPVWSPDSQRIVFCAPVGPLDEEDEDGKPLPKARVIDQLWYRLDGAGYIYECRQHLFMLDVNSSGEPQQLTAGDWDDGDPAWSPDGTQLAFTSSREEDRWRLPCSDVYTLSLANGMAGEVRRLTDGTLSCGVPSWSPDGKTIAFLAALKLRSANHIDLYTIAGSGQGSPRCLTTEFEGSCMDWTNSDMSDDHLMIPPAWSADGKTLYVLAAQRGASRVFAVPSTGIGNQIAMLTPGNVHVMDFSASSAASRLALLIEDPTHIGEIFLCSTTTPGELQKLTGFNDALLHELVLATPEYMPYTGADGWPMDSWIMKPQDFDPAKKYPLIVEIHGGPNTQYGYGFFHEMQLLVAQGYVVLYTNPRGSCGYGREFALAVRGDWGTKDSLDIMAGVDVLLQKGYIDEQRMGVTGGSYGGFMTNWLIGHTNRFSVAVTDRSVTNLASDFGSGDFGWTFADDELETTPWDDLDRYMQHSPIKYVKNIQTPLLIIHSEQDLRCNIEQAEQLFASLKYMGREVLFVRFEGQSHGLSRGGHPKLRLERLKHITGWFEKYLKSGV
ncbi:MAG TPA: S9 family peptidase [Ktedonobacteraceae bacterium]|nr:S9 family peptidase [Ktedonobacteraceae bacterium]